MVYASSPRYYDAKPVSAASSSRGIRPRISPSAYPEPKLTPTAARHPYDKVLEVLLLAEMVRPRAKVVYLMQTLLRRPRGNPNRSVSHIPSHAWTHKHHARTFPMPGRTPGQAV